MKLSHTVLLFCFFAFCSLFPLPLSAKSHHRSRHHHRSRTSIGVNVNLHATPRAYAPPAPVYYYQAPTYVTHHQHFPGYYEQVTVVQPAPAPVIVQPAPRPSIALSFAPFFSFWSR